MSRMKSPYVIITSQLDPPVTSRHFDWQAYLDGHEELGLGSGATEHEAICDLVEILFE